MPTNFRFHLKNVCSLMPTLRQDLERQHSALCLPQGDDLLVRERLLHPAILQRK